LIFAPFNFAVLFGSRNKGHANIKGFTVCQSCLAKLSSIKHTSEDNDTVCVVYGCVG